MHTQKKSKQEEEEQNATKTKSTKALLISPYFTKITD